MPWTPNDKYLWDSWFAFKGDELHAFYLQADKAACGYQPEARHNLASVGHAVMTRGGWQELNGGPALARAAHGAWDDLAIWTGSVVPCEKTGGYLLFYTARRREDELRWTPAEWQRPQHIGVAWSADLLMWQRTSATQRAPVIPNPDHAHGFDGVAWRDPYVMRATDEVDGLYYVFICARRNPEQGTSAPDAGGVVAYVTSPDLEHWSSVPTLVQCPDEFYQMEVPQVFWRAFADGKRCYLIFCAQEKDGSRARRKRGLACVTGTYYLKSALLPHDYVGVPAFDESARLLVAGLYAGKLLKPESDAQPVLLGFPYADAAGHFHGGISDPLLTRFADNGDLALVEGEDAHG